MLAVGNGTIGLQAPPPALASDPISDAKERQAQLERTLRQQETQLVELRETAASLDEALNLAQAELAEISAEYERIFGLLAQVTVQIDETVAQIAQLRAQIEELDEQLQLVEAEIEEQTDHLHAREALLQEHLRTAYERSQTTILELLLTAESLEAASNQVGYLLTMSEQDRELADEVRHLREELREQQQVLSDGRRALAQAEEAAAEQQAALESRQAELAAMEARLAELKVAADQRRAEQEALLNTTLAEHGNVEQSYAENAAAAEAQAALVQRLIAEEAERQRQIEEARRLEAERRAREEAEARRAEEEARRAAEAEAQRRAAEAAAAQQAATDQAEAQRQADEAARRAAEAEAQRRAAEEARRAAERVSTSGFRWPEARFRITQEFGPTSFALEPPYTYRGTWYRHFHTGIDMANGCGTPIMAAREGVVVASGQPLAPYDSAYGVIIGHGDGIYTWYWHLQPTVIVRPGNVVTTGQVIGYEGTTGFSTGCHLHFAIHVNGAFENPRFFLP